MKYLTIVLFICAIFFVSNTASAQTDSTKSIAMDSTFHAVDSIKQTADSAIATAVPSNCYKQWLDYFTELGSKPLTDGTHPVIIAFKNKEGCHCYMGKVEVAGGKIKAPVYIEQEGGDFKTFTAIGKTLDPEFLAAQGDALWNITNGMSVLFQTTDQEYGRIFFYKFLNKKKGMNKEAPSPSDLIK